MSQSERNVDEQSVTTSTSEPLPAESETDEASDAPPEPSLDLIFEILKNSRRREVIKYLRERDERVSLSDLAEHVAAVENGITTAELSSSQRKRVYVGLYQCHLPKMDDAGVIDYERSRGTIELRPASSQCFVYLDVDRAARSGGGSRAGRLATLLTPLTSLLGLR